MSGIFGHLNISDTDRVFSSTVGQEVIFEAAQEYFARVNAEIDEVTALFIEEQTEQFKERYKLPGGGALQRRGPDGRYGAVKAYGQWDVAYPLEDFGAQIASNDVAMAYMTVGELDRHLQTVAIQNINTMRWEVLHRLLDNVQTTFVDPLHGNLAIEPLANGDSVTYPPVLGSEAEATDNHYLGLAYAATAISDTNNPYPVMLAELEEHFGVQIGGSDVYVFINPDETPETEDLTDFDPISDRFIAMGDDADEPFGFRSGLPGRVIGRTNGVWVVEWRWMPSAYMFAIHGDATPPLKKRVDPADTGLARGLQIVARDEAYPFEAAFYRHRFGLGCGNRLNGVAAFIDAGGSYVVPSAYD